MHNFLYALERNQKKAIKFLTISFLILSVVWWVAEYFNWQFPLEPIVVMVGGFATLFSVYWPWKGGNASCRLRGRVRFKYSTNNGLFSIGRGDAKFTLQFSKSSDADIYLYNDPSDIEAVALAGGVGQTSDIKDASSFDFSNRVISVGEGKAAVLRRHNKKYAVVQIHDVIVSNIDDDDSVDEVVFTYTINTNGSADFS